MSVQSPEMPEFRPDSSSILLAPERSDYRRITGQLIRGALDLRPKVGLREFLALAAGLTSAAVFGITANTVSANSGDAPYPGTTPASKANCKLTPPVLGPNNIVSTAADCRVNGKRIAFKDLKFTATLVEKDSSGAICGDPRKPRTFNYNKVQLSNEGIDSVSFTVSTKKPVGGDKYGKGAKIVSAKSLPFSKDMGNDGPDQLMCGKIDESYDAKLPPVANMCAWGAPTATNNANTVEYCGKPYKTLDNDFRGIALWTGPPTLDPNGVARPSRITSPTGKCLGVPYSGQQPPDVGWGGKMDKMLTWDCGLSPLIGAKGERVIVEESVKVYLSAPNGKYCLLPDLQAGGAAWEFSLSDTMRNRGGNLAVSWLLSTTYLKGGLKAGPPTGVYETNVKFPLSPGGDENGCAEMGLPATY